MTVTRTKYGLQADGNIVPPSEDTIFLKEVKDWIRVEDNDEELLITGIIDAALKHIDGPTGVANRTLINSEYVFEAYSFDEQFIELPYPSVSEVVELLYREHADDDWISSMDHEIRFLGATERRTQIAVDMFPRCIDVRLRYRAGGYTKPSELDGNFKTAVLVLIDHFYDNRGQGLPSGPAWCGLVNSIRFFE